MEYETRFQFWDNDGNPLPGASVSCPLILITHDESIFFQNNKRKTNWNCENSRPVPKPKGEGQSLMVSDFLTAEWCCLHDDIRSFLFYFFLCTLLTTLACSEAHIVFKPGKNRNGFFNSTELITQVNRAIDIFEGKAKGLARGLFLFNNAPSHLKRSADAISATKMVKSVCVFFFCYFDILISCKIPSTSGHIT